jgi:hypothetical protein
MRKHVVVDHDVITQSILVAALSAHRTIKPSAKRAASKAASLALIEQALERLDPKIAAAVRQEQGEKALADFLAGRLALKKRQTKAVQEYEEAYKILAQDVQDALIALAPPPSLERAPTPPQPTSLLARDLRGPLAGIEHTSVISRKVHAVHSASGKNSDKRIALVIGNSGYREAPLVNPSNDAKAMATLLHSLGFEVITHENLMKRAMDDAIRAFGKRLRTGGVGLFYFAGHGVQVNGYNYLLPVGSVIEKEQDVEYDAVEVGRVMREMEVAENRLNIVILDACRNNPFTRSFRTATRGLVAMNAPSGMMVAYATAPGTIASDGDGPHGLYTQELLQHMRMPGVKLEEMFKRVRVSVKAKSQGKQLPWEASSLEEDFYFVQP